MNPKLLLKTIFLMAVLLLLVIMGMNNRHTIELSLPPIFKSQRLPAAFMYFGFFATGVLSGTVLTAGGGGKRSSGKSKPDK
ncbi:MAG: hypothetical protein WCR20_07380 [Verrucomicrobiota bacterium]|jgi:uncharacterized integral membrane protein|nr:hypothetical protein [Verrucomicrobiota bacterium]